MQKETWTLDATHSELQFKIKHLMISTVTGQFNQFSASMETLGDDLGTAKVHFTAPIHSVSTNNAQRDAHLLAPDFFDAANYPDILFEGERMEKTGTDEYTLHGQLTMKGVTRPVALDIEFGGLTRDPWGNTRTGFSISAKINRQDFGISYGAVTDTGGLLLGDEVRILANIQLVKQVVAHAA